MKRQYDFDTPVTKAKQLRIDQANEIIVEYRAQGFDLTLRQLYYQFVARGLVPNKQNEYRKLLRIVSDGRMAGLIDWRAIVDRTRNLRGNQHWDSVADIIESCAYGFRYDLWEKQDVRIEVWIEKDALLGVIADICRTWDVPYFSCRGYVSASEMWSAARRVGRHLRADQDVVILHLGDHDPSGVHMTDDIRDRLDQFTMVDHVYHREANYGRQSLLTVKRIALTMDQVEELNPPPNPAKITDPRAKSYIEEFGEISWELDALEPAMMSQLIDDEIGELVDADRFEDAKRRQQRARDQIMDIAQGLEDEEE